MKSRPLIVAIFGTLNFVFGILALLGTCFSVLVFLIPQNFVVLTPRMEEIVNARPYFYFISIWITLGALATFVLLASGVGLLRMRPWGRSYSIGYSVYTILSGIACLFVDYCLLLNPLQKLSNALGPTPGLEDAIYGSIGFLLDDAIGLVYPTLLLIVMLKTNVKTAFSTSRSNDKQSQSDWGSPVSLRNDPDNPYEAPHAE